MVDTHRSLKQRVLHIGSNDRFIAATRWCAIVVAVLQLLLAGLATWILVDLHIFGTPIRPLAFLLATTFVAIELTTLFFAATLRSTAPLSLWFLAARGFIGLAMLGLTILGSVANADLDVDRLILQPGAVLPPNEIMGRGWPIGLAILSIMLAQFLAIFPLPLVMLVLAGRKHQKT